MFLRFMESLAWENFAAESCMKMFTLGRYSKCAILEQEICVTIKYCCLVIRKGKSGGRALRKASFVRDIGFYFKQASTGLYEEYGTFKKIF